MNIQDLYPLTNAQKRIWYSEKFFRKTSISNLGVMVTFKTTINFKLFEKAVSIFINQNEIVRTRLTERDCQEPYQYLSRYELTHITFYNFSEISNEDLKKWLKVEMEKPFNLYDENLFDFALFKLSDKESGFFAKFHHIILDGVSVVNAINQIIALYIKLLNNVDIIDRKSSYLDYLKIESAYSNSNRYIKAQKFWHNEFSSLSFKVKEDVDLYNLSTEAKLHSFVISNDLYKIHDFCKQNNISIFNIFLSLLYIYLNRITPYNDIVLGTSFANRTTPEEKEMLGMFASTTPFRMKLLPDLDVVSFIREVSKKQMSIVRHQKYPYNILINELRNKNHEINRLFNISIEYQILDWEKKDEFEYMVEPLFCGHELNELSFHVKNRLDSNQLQLDIDYRTEIYTFNEITNMFEHLHTLLNDLLNYPNKKLSELIFCIDNEKEDIFFIFIVLDIKTSLYFFFISS